MDENVRYSLSLFLLFEKLLSEHLELWFRVFYLEQNHVFAKYTIIFNGGSRKAIGEFGLVEAVISCSHGYISA